MRSSVIVVVAAAVCVASSIAVADDGSGSGSSTSTSTSTAKVKWTDEEPVLGGATRVSGDEAGDVVAFTFDDGPNEATTPAVLEALATYDVPATFFIVTKRIGGKRGRARRELLMRTLAEGHTIGSHTVSHPLLTTLDKAGVVKEIDSSLRQLTHVVKEPVGLFRPPFGAISAAGQAHLLKRNLTDVRWSLDSHDFRIPNAKKLRARVTKMIAAGGRGVILFHDTKQSTARAIGPILDDLEAMNCARLAAGEDPVLPVSLHYFLRDKGVPRTVPDPVEARTRHYKAHLPQRCASRPEIVQPPEDQTGNSGVTSDDPAPEPAP